jgi:caffeic acid 3-O-methyltransferase / acetylserotonin O-methyltransferase
LQTILHNWDDEHCLKLLKNCYKAIPNDGKVIVVESILPILHDNTITSQLNSQLDLIMMTLFPGGKERTQNEFIELALGSGFSGINFVSCISGSWVMEFFK